VDHEVVRAAGERFEIVRRLGEGGMGIVYEARDRARGIQVALKTLRTTDPSRLVALKREFRSLSDIAHPNLVSLYELVSVGERCFFTMELVAGAVDFMAHVRPGEPLPGAPRSALTVPLHGPAAGRPAGPRGRAAPVDPIRLARALRQLVEGVHQLHGAGVLHCDLKPSNVLVTDGGRVVICDFGLAIDVRAPGGVAAGSSPMGTAIYMSPEQAAGLPLGPASDWYSVGVMLYEALAGRAPFEGVSREVMARKQLDAPPLPSMWADRVPADLEQLAMEMLQRRPADRPPGAALLARLGCEPGGERPASVRRPTREPRLIGRELHLGLLERALAEVAGGRALVVHVRGQSGMGKTALVRRFVDQLVDRDAALVLSGRCYDGETVAYNAVDGVIDALSTYLAGLPVDRARELLGGDAFLLARLFPVLGRVEPLAGADPADRDIEPVELRRRAFSALRELLAQLAARRPVVLWIDDLQRADRDSAALLSELVHQPDAPAILLIGCLNAAAPHGLASAPALAPGRATEIRELLVEELDEGQAIALARALLEEDGAGDADAARVARESRGIPFFVQDLVGHASTGGASLEEVLQARLGQLPADAREILTTVAVAGRPLARAVVHAAHGRVEDHHRALSLLRIQRLLRLGGDRDSDAVEPYHDRIGAAVTAALSADQLRACHRRIAVSLESLGHADAEMLASHWLGAGRPDLAGRHAEAAAGQASAALAFDRAARLYRVALARHDLDVAVVHALEVRLADALANAGRGPEAAEVYLKTVASAGPAEAIELRRRACEQFLRSGHLVEGVQVMEEMLASVDIELACSPATAILSVVARRTRLRLRGLQFRERAAGEIAPERLLRLDILGSVAGIYGLVDNLRGNDFQARHLHLALETGEPVRIARGLAAETVYSAIPGGSDERRTRKLESITAALADRLGDPHVLALSATTRGMAAFLRGHWTVASELCEEGGRLFRERCTGSIAEARTAEIFALAALGYQGELAAVGRRVPDLLMDAERRGDLYTAGALRGWRSNTVWLVEDDVHGARHQLEEAFRHWPRDRVTVQHYYELLSHAQIDLYTGRGEQALERLKSLWPVLRRHSLLRVQIIRTELLFLRARAELAVAARSGSATDGLARAAADARRIEREGMTWSRPLAGLVRAGVAACRADPDAAAALLAAAGAELAAADMAFHAAVADRCRGALIGGDCGRNLIAASDVVMAAQGVRRPERMTAMLAPGLPGGE